MPAAKSAQPVQRTRDRLDPEERKARLVEATLRCMKLYGFQGTSVRKICAEAGGSIGLINHHYASKDDLVAESYLQMNQEILQRLRDAVAACDPAPRAQLQAVFKASFSPDILSPHLLETWIGFWGAVRSTDTMQKAHDSVYAEYREVLSKNLHALAREHSWRSFDAGLAAISLNALLDGLWLEWGLNSTTFTPEQGMQMCEAWVEGLVQGGHKSFRRRPAG